MTTFLVILHVIVCLAVVLVVLLQAGKGADIGATFGSGGSQTIFGSRGAGTFLTKVTAIAGTIFMLTSLALAITSSHGTKASIIGETPSGTEAPMPQGMPPAGMPQQGQFAPKMPGQSGAAVPAKPAAPAPQPGK
jgi:preprotein translocase subunit SecG